MIPQPCCDNLEMFGGIGMTKLSTSTVIGIFTLCLGLMAVVTVHGLAAAEPSLSITAAGQPETVFRWAADACARDDIPDAPARAFRDAAGRVHLIASHDTNRALVGGSLDKVRPDCRVIFKGGEQDDPSRFDDRDWIAATYTEDGKTVHALVHNEFQGHRRRDLCPSGKYMACWNNSVTEAVSTDGGLTFAPAAAPPNHVVATLPYRYSGGLGHHVGYFNPSNIVKRDNHYYALVFAVGQDAQKGGACLIRTDRLGDPASWRAWDGGNFAVSFADPYRKGDGDPAAHVCTPVGKGSLTAPVSSITLHEPSGTYIALMAATRPEGGGIFAATSRDLIQWSAPKLILPLVVTGKQGCDDADAFNYPSLLDPNSSSRNFESTGNDAYIYLTRFSVENCHLGMNRDLLRLKVKIAGL